MMARIRRLMLPAVLMAVLAISGKWALSPDALTGDPVSKPLSALWDLMRNADNNPALTIWYLIVLLIYSLVTPHVLRLTGGRTWPLVLIALPLAVAHITPAFYIDRTLNFFLYFILGVWAGQNRARYRVGLDRYWIWAALAFAVSLSIYRLLPAHLVICGLLSIPALHGLMSRACLAQDRFWLFWGRHSLAIYILNTMTIGAAKLVLAQLVPLAPGSFVLWLVVLFVSGAVLPVLADILYGRILARVKGPR